jgi:hypothetical protein
MTITRNHLLAGAFAVLIVSTAGAQQAQEPATPEAAQGTGNTAPDTARDTNPAAPETASDDTRVATAESAPASDVRTSETDRDRGVAAPVTGREDPKAPGNEVPPDQKAVRPMAQAQQEQREGCWVKLYDSPNFAGADVMLVGAASMRAMEGPFRSLEVGPSATVTAYKAENFGGSIQRFDPGHKLAEISQPQEFGSLRVYCPRTQGTPARG